jgi:hypothetical protein
MNGFLGDTNLCRWARRSCTASRGTGTQVGCTCLCVAGEASRVPVRSRVFRPRLQGTPYRPSTLPNWRRERYMFTRLFWEFKAKEKKHQNIKLFPRERDIVLSEKHFSKRVENGIYVYILSDWQQFHQRKSKWLCCMSVRFYIERRKMILINAFLFYFDHMLSFWHVVKKTVAETILEQFEDKIRFHMFNPQFFQLIHVENFPGE